MSMDVRDSVRLSAQLLRSSSCHLPTGASDLLSLRISARFAVPDVKSFQWRAPVRLCNPVLYLWAHTALPVSSVDFNLHRGKAADSSPLAASLAPSSTLGS